MAQTYSDLEIVVSDDGSTDGTDDVISGFGDPRVRLVRSPIGTGVSAARNRGIEAAVGRWVAVCDDDDLWHPDKLTDQIALLGQTGRRWSCAATVHVDDDFSILHATPTVDENDFESEIAHGNPVPGGCSSVVVERDLLEQVGAFDPDFSMFADWDLWIRLYDAAGLPAASDEFGVLYLVHSEQMSSDLAQLTGELHTLRRKHKLLRERLGTPPIDAVDYWAMVTLRRAGRFGDALRHAWSGAAGRGPMALRYSFNALSARLGPECLPEPTDDDMRARQQRARRAVDDVRQLVEVRK